MSLYSLLIDNKRWTGKIAERLGFWGCLNIDPIRPIETRLKGAILEDDIVFSVLWLSIVQSYRESPFTVVQGKVD